MSKKFSIEEIRNAKEVHLHNDNLFLVDAGNVAWCFNELTGGWDDRTDSFDSYWESELMMCYFQPITKEEFVEEYKKRIESSVYTD